MDAEKRKAYNKAYYLNNREKIITQREEYRQTHGEECRAYAKKYYVEHRQQVRERQKKYYLKYQDAIRLLKSVYWREKDALFAVDAKAYAEHRKKRREYHQKRFGYKPTPALVIPDWATKGQVILDSSSKWLWNNRNKDELNSARDFKFTR